MTAGHCIAPVPGHRRPVLVHMCMPINGHARCAAPLSYGQVLARVSGHFASDLLLQDSRHGTACDIAIVVYFRAKLGLSCVLKHDCAGQIGNAIFFMPVTAARAALRVQCRYQNFVWTEARWEISVDQAKDRRGKEVR